MTATVGERTPHAVGDFTLSTSAAILTEPRTFFAPETMLDLSLVHNPVVRDLLSEWDGPPTSELTPVTWPGLRQAAISSARGRTQQLTTAVVSALLVLGAPGSLIRWSAQNGVVHPLGPAAAEAGFNEETDDARSGGRLNPLEAIQWSMSTLGVPAADILVASNIKRRTYQLWQQKPDTDARLSSQGDLWGLMQTIEMLRDQVGADDLPRWIAAEPHRRERLRAGAHRELAREVIAAAALAGVYDDPAPSRRQDLVAAGYDQSTTV